MNLHEYQAKEVLKRHGIETGDFRVASSVEEAVEAFEEMGLQSAVLKIQVHAGGRGKAGGVRFVKSKKECGEVANALLGMKMVNQQTGPSGVIAKQILIARPVEIAQEFYLSVIIDRSRGVPLLIASSEGGMEIEEIAEKSPEKILKLPLSLDGKIHSYQMLRLFKFMKWEKEVAKEGAKLVEALAKCFLEVDASLLEINPLVLTKHLKWVALDAKLSVDDNALYRQKEISSFYDATQVSLEEAKAKEFDLAYIAMHGNIGCMVNGAGLAMATMDIIQLFGGSPANFLDVGGGASKEKVKEGFKIILSDPKVEAILINIFGGIMNCAVLAEGVIAAAKELKVKVPIVVRMEGTNVEIGKKLFKESGLEIGSAEDLEKAAKLAVEKTKRNHGHSHS